jgi:hypothetical protein
VISHPPLQYLLLSETFKMIRSTVKLSFAIGSPRGMGFFFTYKPGVREVPTI